MLFSFYPEMLCLFQRCAVMESAFIFSFSEFPGNCLSIFLHGKDFLGLSVWFSRKFPFVECCFYGAIFRTEFTKSSISFHPFVATCK